MSKVKWFIILLNLIFLMIYFTCSVFKKEDTLENGHLILLELAPVDPRSLMQGDYMILNYALLREVPIAALPKRGFFVVGLDSLGVATFSRVQAETKPLHAGEYLINYTHPNSWSVNLGAESYFFQEGNAEKYNLAKYGGLRVDDAGNSILVGLYDANRNLIQ